MASTSLKTLRQEIGKDLSECWTGTTTEAGSATSLIDSSLKDPDNPDSLYTRDWLKIVSGDQDGDIRRIKADGYNPSTGAVSWSIALTGAIESGIEYEIHALFRPGELDRLINQALTKLWYLYREKIDVVEGQREYNLSAFTWLERPSQVLDVQYIYGSTSLEQEHLSLPWFEVVEEPEAATLTLRIDPLTVDELVLMCRRPYAALATDSATTACPKQWLKAAVLVEVYRLLSRQGPSDDTKRYEKALAVAGSTFAKLSRIYMPRSVVRVQRPR